MLKQLTSLLVLILLALTVYPQKRLIRIHPKVNPDKSVIFSYEKDVPGSYYVGIKFESLENAAMADYGRTVMASRGTLLTLKPRVLNQDIFYRYQSWYIMGNSRAKPEMEFPYLLPIAYRQQTTAKSLARFYTNIDKNELNKNMNTVMFQMMPGDTVFSARKGLVTRVTDKFPYDSTRINILGKNMNEVLIEHEDGTIASYKGLALNQIIVKPGQMILPHEPLGLIGCFSPSHNGQLRFSVIYLNNTDWPGESKGKEENEEKKGSRYEVIEPFFYTEAGTLKLQNDQSYVSKENPKLIVLELTKKEKKRLAKQQAALRE